MYWIVTWSLILLPRSNANDYCDNAVCGCCETSKCVLQGINDYICNGCIPGYTGSKCILNCPANCFSCSQKYYDDYSCDVCMDGFYVGRHRDIQSLSLRNDCSLSCPESCASCSSYNFCIECKSGYYMTADNQCINCPKYCEICFTATKCDKCMTGYYSNGSSCQPCLSNCRTCYSDDRCVLCETGFYLKGHSCNICPLTCVSCSDINMCDACQTGFYFSEGLCKKCYDDCLDCYSANNFEYVCQTCKEGYYSLHGSCIQCDNFCLQCLKNGTCTICEKGYELVKGGCYKCKPLCEFCDTFESCKICQAGYTNFDGECKTCPKNCLNCSSQDVSCETCIDGYYGQTCSLSCSENCAICIKESGECVACKMGNYLNESSKCLKCPQRCFVCQSQSLCNVCEEGFKGNTCRCPLNCICNVGEVCVSCKTGFTGETCSNRCSDGCDEMLCNKLSGECSKGCIPGFMGSNCTKGQTNHEEESADQPVTQSAVVMVGLVLGSATVFFGIVIASALGYLLYKRKRRRKRRRNEQSELLELFHSTLQRKGRPLRNENYLVEIDDSVDTSFLNTATKSGHSNIPLLQKRKIQTCEFEDYVKNKTDAEFTNEFQELPSSSPKHNKESQKKCNQRKNRFREIYPFDDTRVVLKTGDSNYINASFVDGYNKQRAYIASIGPTQKYMGDMSAFWRMIWQENCNTIVMLSSLSEPKPNTCDQYWPETDYFLTYGEFTVSALTEDTFVNYAVRRFEVQLNLERRVVTQFHYTSWSEADVPPDVLSLVTFIREVNSNASNLDGPTVVHCNSGVGRTGTYIALDILTKEGETECHVDVFNCVRNLREQRARMVQTAEQYKFLHLALVVSLNYYAQIFSDSPTQSETSINQQHSDQISIYMSVTDHP